MYIVQRMYCTCTYVVHLHLLRHPILFEVFNAILHMHGCFFSFSFLMEAIGACTNFVSSAFCKNVMKKMLLETQLVKAKMHLIFLLGSSGVLWPQPPQDRQGCGALRQVGRFLKLQYNYKYKYSYKYNYSYCTCTTVRYRSAL